LWLSQNLPACAFESKEYRLLHWFDRHGITTHHCVPTNVQVTGDR
jgi:hypothetical protein